MALAGRGAWEVTAAAPAALSGDLRAISLESIDGEAGRLVPLPMRLGRSAHLRWYGNLRPLMRERWDVVHCWEEPYVSAGWQVARCAGSGSRVVFATFQNIRKAYPPPFNWMERSAMRRADGWIAFGHTVHAALAPDPLYSERPSRIIPPGVDLERFRPDDEQRTRVRSDLGWDERVPVVGFLGRFTPEKGLGVLMAALRDIERPWRALFVGGGPQLDTLRSFAVEYPGRVAVMTGVSHDRVPSYLNAMDVLCAPSQTTTRWREQFGRMLIEAMACGVAVIASDSGEIPHVVQRSGVIVPESDSRSWARELAALLADDERRRRLARAGLERAREEFAWPAIARRHLAFFEEVSAS
jgi:glycosyltransferase involved in cell wall biosynthesis